MKSPVGTNLVGDIPSVDVYDQLPFGLAERLAGDDLPRSRRRYRTGAYRAPARGNHGRAWVDALHQLVRQRPDSVVRADLEQMLHRVSHARRRETLDLLNRIPHSGHHQGGELIRGVTSDARCREAL